MTDPASSLSEPTAALRSAPTLPLAQRLRRSHTLRLLTVLPGSYAFTWGLVALGISAFTAAGVDFHDAETTLNLLAFVVFVAVFLWAFASPHLARVWAVLLLGACGMGAAAWALQQTQLA